MTKPYKTGLAIGKFMPFHRGHELMIEFGASMSDTMNVLISGRELEYPSVTTRYSWLQQTYLHEHGIQVVIDIDLIPDPVTVDKYGTAIDEDFWCAWIEKINEMFPKIDAVFSNDYYGEELAKRLGAEWVPSDPGRHLVPISGTRIRNNPGLYFNYLNKFK